MFYYYFYYDYFKFHLCSCYDFFTMPFQVAFSQYIALELTHSNTKDTKLLARHFPWLLHPPSSIEQGFSICFFHPLHNNSPSINLLADCCLQQLRLIQENNSFRFSNIFNHQPYYTVN